jgi:opacity protein-like surface antigen
MRSLKLALLATAATAALSSAAFAADLIVDTPPEAPVIDNGSMWDGAYVGLYLEGSAPWLSAFSLGADLGVNVTMDNFVLGGELSGSVGVGTALGGTFLYADGQGTVKAGVLAGDTALIYAYTGIGTRTWTSWYVPLGLGAEFAVADNIGLKAEAQYNFDLTGWANSATAKVGVNFHF